MRDEGLGVRRSHPFTLQLRVCDFFRHGYTSFKYLVSLIFSKLSTYVHMDKGGGKAWEMIPIFFHKCF